ncbi:mycothione reductase [Microlunatus sagamiharensis]|uniref:Mycothione reductase n=1 Tax=Microlunatus sagamiharensis TaxID=546874 RepID=A0A1H2NHC4_9ACTN|nr:mycothione reductase [Microlunatus sagamiharensis]SDV04842.1 mycothione reductase [Microlunatus sagamiharensis]
MRHFDLCVIGSGSGNSVIDDAMDGWSVAMVEAGTFGGTCLNVGCIPTKMYVYPADLAASPQQAKELGVDLELVDVRWPDIRDRIFGRIDPISSGGRDWRAGRPNVTLYEQRGRFVGDHELLLEARDGHPETTITADRFVLANGSRAVVPPFPGIDAVPYETSDTVMRLDALPRSMVIVGGGYIAAEFAHVFSSYGVQVTIVGRSPQLLSREDAQVSERFTELLGRRVDVRTSTEVQRVDRRPSGDGVVVTARTKEGVESTIEADVLLVATGRTPNADTLDLDRTGVEVDDDGRVVVDSRQRTGVEGIFALGDVSSAHQLKHVANHEARVVKHNLLHPDAMVESDHRYVPHAVFSDPQVAAVGLTEAEAEEQGLDYAVAVQDYGSTAYGWAMGDEDHFVKLVGERGTGRLLGAHLIGPQASSLIQPLIQAMSFGLPAHAMARGQYWIHPAMAEVVENALLALPSSSED